MSIIRVCSAFNLPDCLGNLTIPEQIWSIEQQASGQIRKICEDYQKIVFIDAALEVQNPSKLAAPALKMLAKNTASQVIASALTGIAL